MLDFDWLDNLNVEVYNPVNVFDEQTGIFESAEVCRTDANGKEYCAWVDVQKDKPYVTGGGVKVKIPF